MKRSNRSLIVVCSILVVSLAVVARYALGGKADAGAAPSHELRAEAAAPVEAALVSGLADPAQEQPQPAAALGAEREELGALQGGPAAHPDAEWIDGRVLLPAGASPDESMRVRYRQIANAPEGEPAPRARAGGWTARSEEAIAVARRELLEGDVPNATAPVAPDGRFRIALLPSSAGAEVALDARTLYSDELLRAERGAGSLELRASFGACVEGRLLPPSGAQPLELARTRVTLGRQVSSLTPAAFRERELARRGTHCDEQGAFEIRGLPAGPDYVLAPDPANYACPEIESFALAPGELRRIEVKLLVGARVLGRVLDAAGAPVPEAEVRVMAVGGGDGGGMMGVSGQQVEREAETDEQGAFELGGLPPGRLRLLPQRDGYLDSVGKAIEVSNGQTLGGIELVLDRGNTIRGHVRFADGTAAEKARVEAELDPSAMMGAGAMNAWRGREGDARTDSSGAFEITGLGKGPFTVRVQAKRTTEDGERDGHAVARKVAPNGEPLELVLQDALTLDGLVRDPSGAPVPSFTIELQSEQGAPVAFGAGARRSELRNFEDAEGRFRLLGLESGEWRLRASTESVGSSEWLTLELPRNESEPLVLNLRMAASVAGLVLAPDGSPAAGARVEHSASGPGSAWAGAANWTDGNGARCDERGAFVLEQQEPGSLVLHAVAEGAAASEDLSLELAPGEARKDVVLRLREGGRVRGLIYDKQGEPQAGRPIMAVFTSTSEVMQDTSDSRGEFGFEHMRPGDWQIIAIASQDAMMDAAAAEEFDATAFMQDMKFKLIAIADREEVEVVLGAPPEQPVHVSGRVESAGEGVRAMVSFVPVGSAGMDAMRIASSDATGAYETELDQPGEYLVTVQQLEDIAGRQNSIEFLEQIPAEPRYELELELPLGLIAGRVTDERGQPIAGARVTLTVDGPLSSGFGFGGNFIESSTGEDGRYALKHLRAGRYSVGAGGSLLGGMLGETSAYGRQVRAGLELAEGGALQGVDFELGGSGSIDGRVLDEQGKPATELAIFVRDSSGRLIERLSFLATDSSGRFRCGGLAAGEYTVSARGSARATKESAQVRVRSGETSKVELVAGAGTELRVSLVDAQGEPMRAAIEVLDSEGRQVNGMMGMSELMANFRAGINANEQKVGPLPPGDYRVKAYAADGKSASKPVTLNGQAEGTLKLRLKD